jgi:peptide/nickel transport system permease protein
MTRYRYILKRIFQALVVLWGSFTITFILLQAMPGDAVLIKFMNPEMGLSPRQIEEIRLAYGADSPVILQYFHSLANFVTGNFGYSMESGVTVRELMKTNLPPTMRLAGLAFCAALILAGIITILSFFSPFRFLRSFFHSLPPLLISIPAFWLGIMLAQVFSFKLGLISIISPGPVEEMILPVLTLSVPIAAPIAQVLIRNLDSVLTLPFITVVKAKGASLPWIYFRHALRNSVLPALTIAGVLFGELMAGAVVTETVFGLNGIGHLTERAVDSQDVAVLQTLVMFCAASFVFINLVVDMLYPVLDPRLRGKTKKLAA